jgi:hypothetical protein
MLRKEPTCLNYGTSLLARFCHQFGQENTEPHESLWALNYIVIASVKF